MWSRIIAFALLVGCGGKAAPPPAAPAHGYDAALAQRLGADEHGMHKYVIAFLKPGPHRDQPEDEARRLMKAHLDNIGRMAAEGKLVVAGPFLDEGDIAGIYIFDVPTLEEAAALTATDPAIAAGRLTMELRPWYGSAALREVGALHKRIEKKSPADD
ncbi:MAG: hypothetical protein KIT31_07605 [Deltaproteobacteria bacterium]|nr:hypothetical protein [Deltaproteobacteria bacterium]